MNVIKLTPETLSSIFEELAKGEQSIKAILKDKAILANFGLQIPLFLIGYINLYAV